MRKNRIPHRPGCTPRIGSARRLPPGRSPALRHAGRLSDAFPFLKNRTESGGRPVFAQHPFPDRKQGFPPVSLPDELTAVRRSAMPDGCQTLFPAKKRRTISSANAPAATAAYHTLTVQASSTHPHRSVCRIAVQSPNIRSFRFFPADPPCVYPDPFDLMSMSALSHPQKLPFLLYNVISCRAKQGTAFRSYRRHSSMCGLMHICLKHSV